MRRGDLTNVSADGYLRNGDAMTLRLIRRTLDESNISEQVK